jgi:SAM-dependent methyltransferase
MDVMRLHAGQLALQSGTMDSVSADIDYRRLKQAGQAGWGGAQYGRRLAGWIATLGRLQHESLIPAAPARLLELGCGNGMVAIEAARRGYQVAGVDVSGKAVAWAREAIAEAGLAGAFLQGDVCAMPFFDAGAFDLAVDGNCLHCIFGDDRGRVLNETFRVLRPGGTFIVSTMCGEPKSEAVRRRFDRASGILFENGSPHRMLKSAEAIEAEVARAGFRLMDRTISINPWWDHLTLVAVAH